MNQKILQSLEFDKVKEFFAFELTTAQGSFELEKLVPTTDKEKVQTSFRQLQELTNLMVENGQMPLKKTEDITEGLKRLELGAILSAKELARIKRVAAQSQSLTHYFTRAVNVNFPALQELTDKFSDLSALIKFLEVLDDEGALYDHASVELARLRADGKRLSTKIHTTMQELLVKRSSALTEMIITMREDRPVLAVKASHKAKISGIVHDISSTGLTLYMEPSAVAELGNTLVQTRLEEKNEISRILSALTEKLVPYIKDLHQNTRLIGQLDLFVAKARVMKKYKASIPEISKVSEVMLRRVRHPLITADKVVANDIFFDRTLQTIVITGPNTGGKTIILKTLGLSVLMAQAGLPLWADAGSSISIFSEICADIGDEQSIEASLSTFSSHLTAIVDIVKKADARTLILLDELGAGTDPKEGAALAIAILDYLKNKGAKTLATTHYPELKAYGFDTKGVINSSMAFDIEQMRPTYRFHLGVPGHSNAFEISRRLGLPEVILKQAETSATDNEHTINAMIASLENRTLEAEETLENVQRLEYTNRVKDAELSNKLQILERERDKFLEKAKEGAIQIVKDADIKAQEILKHLDARAQLKPHEIIKARSELADLMPDLSSNKVLKKARAMRGLRAGAKVSVTQFDQTGELIKREKDGRWTVAVGNVMTRLDESDFVPLEPEEKLQSRSSGVSKKVSHNVQGQLDLRGMRYEEALLELESYIDMALLNNFNQITIIHGIGTGVIRSLVRNTLAKHKHIKSFEYAPQTAGGSGATIAMLK